MQITKEKVKKTAANASGSLIVLLSGIVIYGWFTKNEMIIRLNPKYAAMVFNTALSFFVMGIGFIFLPTKYIWVTRIAAGFVILLNFFICTEHMFGVDLGVDQIFFKYNLDTPMKHPGRTSINTALTFLVASISLLLLTIERKRITIFIILTFSCFSLALPTANLFGYMTGLESSAVWSSFAKMALHTSIGCIMMSGTLLTYAIIETLGHQVQVYALSLAVALSTVIATSAIWRLIITKDYITAKKTASYALDEVELLINQYLKEDVSALQRFAERLQVLGGYSKEYWDLDASNYLKDLPSLERLEIIDKDLQVIAFVGKKQSSSLAQSQLNPLLQKDLKEGKIGFTYSKSVNQLNIFIPIIINNDLTQFFYAIINMDVIYNHVINLISSGHYETLFIKGNQVVFASPATYSPTVGPPLERIIAEKYSPITVKLFITKKALKETSLNLEIFIIVIGIFMASISGGIIYFALKTKEKEKVLEILNKDVGLAREKANQASVAKSMFLSTMSHEIRTPLNAVLGTIQILNETNLDETQKKYMHRIDFSGRALLNLINDILDYSKIEAGSLNFEKVPFDAMDISQKVCEGFMLKSVETKVALLFEGPEHAIPVLLGDPHRLEQLLVNLITNAFKFTQQGEITVKMAYKDKDPGSAILRFEVIDTGVGISQANQVKLFQKFSQIHASDAAKSKGVGLGLSICKGLIDKMQGQIGIVSQEGKGSTFWFEIPYEIEKPDQKPGPYSLENVGVMVLDTNQKQRDLIVKYLNAWKTKTRTEFSDDFNGVNIVIISTDQGELIEKVKQKNVPILYVDNNNPEQIAEDLLVQPITSKSLWASIDKKRSK